MKKFLSKIVTVIIAICLSVTTLSGCNLIAVDNQKDMDQIVAEVSIGGGAPKEPIYKKDLVVMYMNYGYSYVQNGSYTQKQAFEMIMDSLVSNILMVQTAMKEMPAVDEDVTDTFNVDRYLTVEEKAKALYETNKGFNDLIESYMENEEDVKETETETETARTTPTNATNVEEEKDIDFYKEYNEAEESYLNKGLLTGFDDDRNTTDIERKKAYNKVLKALDANGLLGDDFNFETGSIYDTAYYKDNLTSQKESILLEKYQKKLTFDIISKVSYEDLASKYAEMYNKQANDYSESISNYETALDAASSANPIVYHPNTGYSYVYNLLLGVNDAQSAEITEINGKSNVSNAEKKALRENVLKGITVTDLRSSWVTAGYDADVTTDETSGAITEYNFSGDYRFSENGIPFKGTVVCTNADESEEEDYKATYKVTSLEKYSVKEFIDMMDTYIYGSEQASNVDGYYKGYQHSGEKPAGYDDIINDLLFAFSTDGGSLNTYKGYISKPAVDAGKNETYVQEFADAARKVGEFGKGSYIVVGTDFGYHIIFNAETISANSNYATLDAYLSSLVDEIKIGETTYNSWKDYYNAMINDINEYAKENSDFYLYTLQQAYVGNILSAKLNQTQTALINQYKNVNEDGKYEEYKKEIVTIYEKRYEEFLID